MDTADTISENLPQRKITVSVPTKTLLLFVTFSSVFAFDLRKINQRIYNFHFLKSQLTFGK